MRVLRETSGAFALALDQGSLNDWHSLGTPACPSGTPSLSGLGALRTRALGRWADVWELRALNPGFMLCRRSGLPSSDR